MDWITIGEACRIIGGDEKPIHSDQRITAGLRLAGIQSPSNIPSPGISRVRRGKLLAALERPWRRLMNAPPNVERAARQEAALSKRIVLAARSPN